MKKALIKTYRDLEVYQMSLREAVRIFELTKKFPADEKFSLTDQIRKSSRSVCANLAEAWRKRRYKAAFISKPSDSEAEGAETQVWAEMVCEMGYWEKAIFKNIDDHYDRVIGKLVRMIDYPEPWLIKKNN
ncbi:MAG: four helix bundle protein [bacterium]